MGGQRCANGFSLLELMIVVSIAAIMMAMAIPSFHRYRATEYAKTNANNVASVLREARQRAIREGNWYVVVFNPSSTAETPTGTLMRIVQDVSRDCTPASTDPGRNVNFIPDPGGIVRAYDPALDGYNAVLQANSTTLTLAAVVNGATFQALAALPYGGGVARAVCFNNRGLPVDLTATQNISQTTGGFYVSDTRQAVFAAALNPLGEVRMRALGAQGSWQ